MRPALRNGFFLALLSTLTAWPVAAQTADELVGKYYAAAGGLEKFRAVNSLRITGRMTLGQGMEAPFTTVKKRPNLQRSDFTLQGVTATQAYDGHTAWMFMPFMGQAAPEVMPEDLAKEVIEDADFDGPLFDYTARGIKVDLVGKEQVEGTDTYKLQITMKSGQVTYYYLDAAEYLPIRFESKRTIQGRELNIVTSLGDYKPEGGLLLPHSMQITGEGGPGGRSLTIEKVEINPALKDDDFKMPPKPGGDW
jgi:outer membrane lipoprotein-sorting protein